MKPEAGAKSGAKAAKEAQDAATASPFVSSMIPTIDYSKVTVEPLFEEFVDFETFSKNDFRSGEGEGVRGREEVEKSFWRSSSMTAPMSNVPFFRAFMLTMNPEDLVGKTLVAITNLPPRKMMGIDSCGMLLSAIHEENGEERLNLLQLDSAIPAGAKLY